MHTDKNFILHRAHKKPILIDSFYSESTADQPLVIFCHGYKGFKDWGAWNIMGQQIAEAGYCFIKFNFSHNGGTVEEPIDFPDLEAFGNNNFTKELDDLNDVINWAIEKFKNHPGVNTDHIALIGHSRGGGIVIIKASEDVRITKLITLASVSDFGNRMASPEALEVWKNDGVMYMLNGRTKQQMPHYYQFYEDFKANEERLHIETATKRLSIPFLIIHGDKDSSVDIKETHAIHKWSPDSQLRVIEGADHVFNVKHPWEHEKLSNEFQEVTDVLIEFLE